MHKISFLEPWEYWRNLKGYDICANISNVRVYFIHTMLDNFDIHLWFIAMISNSDAVSMRSSALTLASFFSASINLASAVLYFPSLWKIIRRRMGSHVPAPVRQLGTKNQMLKQAVMSDNRFRASRYSSSGESAWNHRSFAPDADWDWPTNPPQYLGNSALRVKDKTIRHIFDIKIWMRCSG
jgi:hypothetical protein